MNTMASGDSNASTTLSVLISLHQIKYQNNHIKIPYSMVLFFCDEYESSQAQSELDATAGGNGGVHEKQPTENQPKKVKTLLRLILHKGGFADFFRPRGRNS